MGTQYCQPSDVAVYALNSIALSAIPEPNQQAACLAASALLDSFFRGRYPLPFLTYGTEVTMMAAYIAAKLAIDGRGSRPIEQADEAINLNYDRAIDWAKGVQRQTIHPDVTFNSNPTVYALPQVRSPNPPRGWTGGGCGNGGRWGGGIG